MIYGSSSIGSATYGGVTGGLSIMRYIGRFALKLGRRAFAATLLPSGRFALKLGRRAFAATLLPSGRFALKLGRRAFALRLPDV